MDVKWLVIMIICVFGGMFAGIGFTENAKFECRLKAIEAKMSVNDIAKVCK